MSGVAVVHGWGPASVWGGYHEAGGHRGRARAFIQVTSCVTRVWVTLPRPQTPQTPPVTPQGPVAHHDKGTRENPALCWAQRKDPRMDPAVPGGSWVGLEAIVQMVTARPSLPKIRGAGPNQTLQQPSAFPEPGAAHLWWAGQPGPAGSLQGGAGGRKSTSPVVGTEALG